MIASTSENCKGKRAIALSIDDFFVTRRVNKNRLVNIF